MSCARLPKAKITAHPLQIRYSEKVYEEHRDYMSLKGKGRVEWMGKNKMYTGELVSHTLRGPKMSLSFKFGFV